MSPSTIWQRLVCSSSTIILQGIHLIVGDVGSETIVDASVRRTWQLAPDDFELRNPKWPPLIQKVTEQVARELGFTDGATVSAQLYKLLLYEEGAMFKRHKEYSIPPCHVPIILIQS